MQITADCVFFFSSRRRHTRCLSDWSSDVCSSDLPGDRQPGKTLVPTFRGWGRACSDFETGLYRFETIKPGAVIGRDGRPMAPHISFWIVARGINIGLHTRMYFSDETAANANDPVINLIEWQVRRQTIIAKREEHATGVVYRFDIRLQGEGETVFFDL